VQIKNPAALAGADRASNRYAVQQSFTTASVVRQALERRLRRQRLVGSLPGLGERATFEFIDELATSFGEEFINRRLTEYTRRLTPELLRVAGGDKLVSWGAFVVGGEP
jgi:hypothetical protein